MTTLRLHIGLVCVCVCVYLHIVHRTHRYVCICLYAKIHCHEYFSGELNVGCVAYLPHNLSPRDIDCYGARNVKL